MQETDEFRSPGAGVAAAENVVREDFRLAVGGDAGGHAGFEEAGKDGVDADVRWSVAAGQVIHQP